MGFGVALGVTSTRNRAGKKPELPWYQMARTYWIPIGVVLLAVISCMGINKLTSRTEICTVVSSTPSRGTNGIAGREVNVVRAVGK